MSRVSEKVKNISSLIAAALLFIFLSLMFFPWFKWEEQKSITGTVERLTISQSTYGSTPYYVVQLKNGKFIKVKAPSQSNYKKDDEIKLRLFIDKRNENVRRYAVKVP